MGEIHGAVFEGGFNFYTLFGGVLIKIRIFYPRFFKNTGSHKPAGNFKEA